MSHVIITGEDFFPTGHVAIKTHLEIESNDNEQMDLELLELDNGQMNIFDEIVDRNVMSKENQNR